MEQRSDGQSDLGGATQGQEHRDGLSPPKSRCLLMFRTRPFRTTFGSKFARVRRDLHRDQRHAYDRLSRFHQ